MLSLSLGISDEREVAMILEMKTVIAIPFQSSLTLVV